MRRKKLSLILLLVLAALLVPGCQTARFYSQAVRGQMRILSSRQPIPQLLENPKTEAKLKTKFQDILEIRAFAEHELKLPARDQYLQYVDLNRKSVVWNVYAAPEFSMAPVTWWFPIVGRASYRGYFAEADAKAYAAALQKKGYDVYVSGVDAYSTLGWFADPVLSTFIKYSQIDLAETLFHELAHQRLFIQGDTEFNEAFATAVAEEGLRRWMEAHGKGADYPKFLVDARRRTQFLSLVEKTRDALTALYPAPDAPPLSPSEAQRYRVEKDRIYAQLRRDYETLKATEWGGYKGYDKWFAESLNNAKLGTVSTYYNLVPAFAAMLQANGGDLEKFFQQVSQLSREKRDIRHQKLLAYLPKPGSTNATQLARKKN